MTADETLEQKADVKEAVEEWKLMRVDALVVA